ncbi:hypothetical protein B0O79_2914 [Flavobacteriaceae bacterium MAR_2009_75]|nr:hypothetical protein B0O79_2914 [Flavobacteriaceae bacterium MAR_2009_75]
MRPNQNLSILFIVLLSSISIRAQGIIEEETDITPENFGSNAQQMNYYSQQSNEILSTETINVSNKGVYINQVGNNNTSIVNSQSQITDLELSQYGNSNKIDLNLKADIIDYSVLQEGDNNLLLEYNFHNNKQLIERSVEQNGNNQNLVIHGSNSIVDKMKIKMSEGSQSLIIRNTN